MLLHGVIRNLYYENSRGQFQIERENYVLFTI